MKKISKHVAMLVLNSPSAFMAYCASKYVWSGVDALPGDNGLRWWILLLLSVIGTALACCVFVGVDMD